MSADLSGSGVQFAESSGQEAQEGKRPMRPDAAAARVLAAAATQVASSIVSGNLAAVSPGHPHEEIPQLLEAARLAAERASTSGQFERG